MAGGTPVAIGMPGWGKGGAAAAGVRYQNTTHARQGDLGSKLPPAPSGTVWVAGGLAEVSWSELKQHCRRRRHRRRYYCSHCCCSWIAVRSLIV